MRKEEKETEGTRKGIQQLEESPIDKVFDMVLESKLHPL